MWLKCLTGVHQPYKVKCSPHAVGFSRSKEYVKSVQLLWRNENCKSCRKILVNVFDMEIRTKTIKKE